MTNSNEVNIRIALVILGIVSIVCIIGGIWLVSEDKTLPDAIIALGSSALTAVALVITRPVGGTQDVRVVDQPVAVDDAGDGGEVETWVVVILCALCLMIGWLLRNAGFSIIA